MPNNGENNFFKKIHQPLKPDEKKKFEDELSENMKDALWEIQDRGHIMRLELEAYDIQALIKKYRILGSRIDRMEAILGDNYAYKTKSDVYTLSMQMFQVRMSIVFILSLLTKKGIHTPPNGKFDL